MASVLFTRIQASQLLRHFARQASSTVAAAPVAIKSMCDALLLISVEAKYIGEAGIPKSEAEAYREKLDNEGNALLRVSFQ